MPRPNRADHEFVLYDDPVEAAAHIANVHSQPVNREYAFAQHMALHFHLSGEEQPETAEAHGHSHETQVKLVDAGELVGTPERHCPRCGGQLLILVRTEYAERVTGAAAALRRAVADYEHATSDLLRYAEPFNSEAIGQ